MSKGLGVRVSDPSTPKPGKREKQHVGTSTADQRWVQRVHQKPSLSHTCI